MGTAMRTVADGCGRQRNVERRHPQPPGPPEWNGNPCYAFGKKWMCTWTADTWLAMRQLSDRCTVVIPDSCQNFTIFVWKLHVYHSYNYRIYATVIPFLCFGYAKVILAYTLYFCQNYTYTTVSRYFAVFFYHGYFIFMLAGWKLREWL